MSSPLTVNVNVTINGDVGNVRMCKNNDGRNARNNDTRCRKCACPSTYGTEGNKRTAQRRKYRRMCADRIARGVCEFCGIFTTTLEVDHANGTHNDDRPENHQVLCVPCHRTKTRLNGEYRKRR